MTDAPDAAVIRFCFIRLSDEAAAAREELAAELRVRWSAACAPYAVWVGLPADDSAARWDLSITIDLPDLAAWQRIAATEEFAALMQQLSERAAVIKAWTFARAQR